MSDYRPGGLTAAVEQAVHEAAKEIGKTAAERAPRRSGDLAGSMKVTPDGAQATIEFDEPYAIRQHEDMRIHHNHGGPKFLESAMTDAASDVGARVAAAVRGALGT